MIIPNLILLIMVQSDFDAILESDSERLPPTYQHSFSTTWMLHFKIRKTLGWFDFILKIIVVAKFDSATWPIYKDLTDLVLIFLTCWYEHVRWVLNHLLNCSKKVSIVYLQVVQLINRAFIVAQNINWLITTSSSQRLSPEVKKFQCPVRLCVTRRSTRRIVFHTLPSFLPLIRVDI